MKNLEIKKKGNWTSGWIRQNVLKKPTSNHRVMENLFCCFRYKLRCLHRRLLNTMKEELRDTVAVIWCKRQMHRSVTTVPVDMKHSVKSLFSDYLQSQGNQFSLGASLLIAWTSETWLTILRLKMQVGSSTTTNTWRRWHGLMGSTYSKPQVLQINACNCSSELLIAFVLRRLLCESIDFCHE